MRYNKYDVIYGEFPDRDGSIQSGYRPGIVIQNNIGNTYSPTLIAIPLTFKIKNLEQGTHMLIECSNEEWAWIWEHNTDNAMYYYYYILNLL